MLKAPFPSAKWFDELVALVTEDHSTFERLGIAELRLGIEVLSPDHATMYGLVFDGLDVVSLGEVTQTELRPEVVLSGALEAWQEMVSSIEENDGADLAHTLNSLTMVGVPITVRSPDPMGSDKLYRYMGTLQAVFDASGSPAMAPT